METLLLKKVILCRIGLVISVSASHTVGGTNCLPAKARMH